ncbi:MAG TPA: hypothetical protein VFW70_24680 [Methylomirabilota bacterium]|nr:hypothetical protein [Methylomirabilota bacterium]
MRYAWLVLAVVLPAAVVLALILWRTPYPISEGIAIVEDVSSTSDLQFLQPARYYYRPLFFASVFAAWHGSDTPATFVAAERLMMIAPIAVLVTLLLIRLRPRTAVDATAAVFASAVLMGSGAFFDNTEIPLTFTIVGMPVLLGAWMLAERAKGPAPTVLFLALAVVAIGFKEQGLVILPIVIAAWWLGAPGVSRATAVWTAAFGLVYLAFRFATKGPWAPFEQDIGFGFSVLSATEAGARFGRWPLPAYAYNSVSTISNLLFAEPTSGVFSITRAIVNREAMPWQYLHLVSSAALTGLIGWWGARSVARARVDGWTAESRTAALLVVALAASGALAFNYSRDRLGGMALVPYAVASFYAVRALLATLKQAGAARIVAVTLGLTLLMGAWQTRVVHTLDAARERAADSHREWLTDSYDRRVQFASRERYLHALDVLTPQGTVRPPGPPHYPAWVTQLLGPT